MIEIDFEILGPGQETSQTVCVVARPGTRTTERNTVTVAAEPTRVGSKAKEEIEKLKTEVEELKRVVGALILAVKEAEDEVGEPLMPEGTYYGTTFED